MLLVVSGEVYMIRHLTKSPVRFVSSRWDNHGRDVEERFEAIPPARSVGRWVGDATDRGGGIGMY